MSNNTYIQPGWYPDPSGAPHQRWWDGTQWSEATQPNAAPPAWQGMPAVSAGYSPAPYATTPYSFDSPAYTDRPGVNPNTPAAWAIAFAPLLVFVELAILFAMGAMTIEQIMDTEPSLNTVNTGDLLLRGVLWILVIVLAIADTHELKRRGVEKPFHWAFTILGIIPIASLVYFIGRTVVAKRRTGRGLAPLFVWIGCLVVSFAVPVLIGLVMGLVYYDQLV